MRQFTRTVITFSVLVVLLFGLYYFTNWFSRTTGYVLGEDEKLNLAQCLNDKNSVFYVSSTCPDCLKQEELFGETAWNFIDVVECGSVEECPKGGVPAWSIEGDVYYGMRGLDELTGISGCSIDVG
tara:strand:+ start:1786 stop:2163 length:378 start_codon:yes stop_codon:yes gene_type:complete